MANLDAVLQAAYDDKVIAGAVVLAKDITGIFLYESHIKDRDYCFYPNT